MMAHSVRFQPGRQRWWKKHAVCQAGSKLPEAVANLDCLTGQGHPVPVSNIQNLGLGCASTNNTSDRAAVNTDGA